MKLAMVGLGRMGMNMARRLLKNGHQVVAFNRTQTRAEELAKDGAEPCFTLAALPEKLESPRIIWLMLPAGATVDEHIDLLLPLLSSGDILVDGGNTHFQDDQRRFATAKDRGIQYVDVGTSGGIWGLTEGYCLMVGGSRQAYEHLEPILASLAPPKGYLYCGQAGAGHYVKMIHNGIEYAMMQSLAEGFALLEASPFGPELDFSKVAGLWNQGSVIRSWLMELAEKAFVSSPRLKDIAAFVEDSGEGRWSVQQALDLAVPAPVMAASLMERFRSRRPDDFGDRLLAALRQEFGGHALKTGSVCGALERTK